MSEQSYLYATGRRKEAVARVKLVEGNGAVIVNGKPYEELFTQTRLQATIMEPMKVTETTDRFSVLVKVAGGGVMGQAGAICHGIARALVKADENFKPLLRSYGLLTRDARVKERKKYGLKRARKAQQYRKR